LHGAEMPIINERGKAEKIPRSVVVIGWQEENEKMYPHVYDALQHLRNIYDEVIYLGDDDRGQYLFLIDFSLNELKKARNVKVIGRKIAALLIASARYLRRRRRLVKTLKCLTTKHAARLVLAIDHTAVYFAERFFPGEVVFWSLDILAEDVPFRVRHGFLERMTLSPLARRQRALIIQDENRERLLEATLGVRFPTVIYLPISLRDSEFCREEAWKRRKKEPSATAKVVQNGWIAENRWSDTLVESFQQWPPQFELYLHGFLGDRMEGMIKRFPRKPSVSTKAYDATALPVMLNAFDIGFVGYKESDSNFTYIENASAQLVDYLRLGIPVIACGSLPFTTFVAKAAIGVSVSHPSEIADAVRAVLRDYGQFSSNARRLYEERHDLTTLFDDRLVPSLESLPQLHHATAAGHT
jgi:hypothetical protein